VNERGPALDKRPSISKYTSGIGPYTLKKLGWSSNNDRTLMDAVYPEDRDKVAGLVGDILATGSGSQYIRLFNEATGEPFWV